MPASTHKFDVHQEITNRIINALESAGEFQLPWITDKAGAFSRPINVATSNHYNGVNIISLWISALAQSYTSNIWGTYRQWQAKGYQVRKGEKASLVVFYKTIASDREDATQEVGDNTQRTIARASWVFNAAQVDGFDAGQTVDLPDRPRFDPIARTEAFVALSGAVVEEAGDKACYIPAIDKILMPERRRFIDTATSSAAECFYSTLLHELTHWTGAASRLGRDLTGRFGKEAYAMEELVAELGAAFLCADLGITPSVREDHASYIRNWLTVLKSDKKAIFTAASKASEAANWLMAKEIDDLPWEARAA